LNFGFLGSFFANLFPNSSDLTGELLVDDFRPDLAALTVFVGATFEACELHSPLAHKRVEFEEFGLELGAFRRYAFHDSRSGSL